MLEKFHKLNERGHKIAYDNYSFLYGASVITVVLPPWYMALPEAERKKPFNMFKLKLMTNVTKKILGLDFADFTVAYISPDPAHRKYEGKTVSECAREEGLSDFDMYIKLVDLSKGQGRLYLGKYYNDDIIRRLMEDDLSVFMTDAWVEEAGTQNGAAYQGFPYFFVRAKQYGIPVEKVVRKMTGATAGVVHNRSIKTTAIVGTVRSAEMIGAKKARTPPTRCAGIANPTPSASETRNAHSVRRKVFPKARQKDASPSRRPVSRRVSQKDGST